MVSFKENRQHCITVDIEKDQSKSMCNPWKEGCFPASDEYGMCVTRLRQLHTRLKKNKELFRDYNNVIEEQVKSGIIEAVPEDDGQGPTHYLPHHGVIRQDRETTKLRVVFDGSAKTDKSSASINECLEKGPNLIPHLFDVVIKFRSYPIAVVADIEKAFHQIQIKPVDRKMLRFLWFYNTDKEIPDIKQYQFRRLVFGLTSSPAILASTIKHHLDKFVEKEPDVTSLLDSSLYVDDLAGGVSNDKETENLHDKAQAIMKEGGFTLRKWNSNSQSFRERIEKDEESKIRQTETKSPKIKETPTSKERGTHQHVGSESTDVETDNSETEQFVKILGIYWDVIRDEFRYDLSDLIEYADSLPVTKRSVLKLSAKIFDPIGLLTPFTISMKILFQDLCIEKVNWDEALDGEALNKWKSFIKDLKALKNVRVPRCYAKQQIASSIVRSCQIHGFSDASERAYAAVVDLRTEFSDGETQVSLVTSKTTVTPMKRQPIPRLELLGAALLAQLIHSATQALQPILQINETFLWTDSFTVLCWIRNEKNWKQYVQLRVNEIRDLTNREDWHFCPGSYNPADLPSRGCNGKELTQNQTWWYGPEFLKKTKEAWPKDPQPTERDEELAHEEIAKKPPLIIHSLVSQSSERRRIDKVIDCTCYSSKVRLLRVTATVLKVVKKWRHLDDKSTMQLNAVELNEAEQLWIKSIQAESFESELRNLEDSSLPSTQLVKQLGLFFDEHSIIRCEGRICNSSLPEASKRPVLLPSRHHFTQLVIREGHKAVHHNGVKADLHGTTLSHMINLRQVYDMNRFV